MGMELVLDIFGERRLAFQLPTPFRRQRKLSLLGESMPNWPHPDDRRFNATMRRALQSSCSATSNALSPRSIIAKISDTFKNLVAMAYRIAPIDWGFSFTLAPGDFDFGISGFLRFQLARTGHIGLQLGASFSLLGIRIEGNIHLSTQGGIVEARLFGRGETPKLCAACPYFRGSLEVRKYPPSQGGHLSVSMELDMSFACFFVRGRAVMDTRGGLSEFMFEAGNPMCFADDLLGAVEVVCPGIREIWGEAFNLRIRRARIFYMGIGGTLSIDLELLVMGLRKVLTLTTNTAVNSVQELVDLVLVNAAYVADIMDDIFNWASLTFIDFSVGNPPVDWGNQFGNGNWARTGRGVTAGGGLRLINGAWSRVGLFGGGFGFNMDDATNAGGNLMYHGGIHSFRHACKLDSLWRSILCVA